jgi:hypothetical protein
MTPNELYAKTPIRTEKVGLESLGNYLEPYLPRDLWCICHDAPMDVEVRYHANEAIEWEYGWAVFSVWFEGKPFMVVEEIGDDRHGYVTDREQFDSMIKQARSLIPPEEACDPDEDLTLSYPIK